MTELVPTQKAIYNMLVKNSRAIESVLPKHLTPERALRIAWTDIQRNPRLGQCTQTSIFNGVIEASMLGLEIGGPLGLAYLVPFKNNKRGVYEAVFIPGYKGFIQLAYNTDLVRTFQFHPVYENDDFFYSYGLNPELTHRPNDDEDNTTLKYAYAIIKYNNGGYDFEVVPKKIAMAAKSRSAAKLKKDSPWNTEDEWIMWCKTAVRRISKRIPQSPELRRAAMLDELADSGNSQQINHVDNVIDIEFDNREIVDTELTEIIKNGNNVDLDINKKLARLELDDPEGLEKAKKKCGYTDMPVSISARQDLWKAYEKLMDEKDSKK